jgi:protein tyrosine phosphatase (PTP) superfamily phosphohydrolase (DUF442 family)
MMKRFRFLLLILSLLISAAPLSAQQLPPAPSMQSAYAGKIHIADVPNAGKINDHFYRGAQPAPAGFAQLKKLGVTTVVDLRLENPRVLAAESRQAEALGLHFVHIPVGGFSAPASGQIVQFLSIFRDQPEQTVFVHCHYGEDRTGVFVAAYRMGVEHWPAEQALREMEAFGFHLHSQGEMKAYVLRFPAMLQSAPELAQFQKTLSITPPSPAALQPVLAPPQR